MKYLIVTNHSYMFWQFRRELVKELLKKGEVLLATPYVGHEKDFMDLGCRCIETKMERRGTNPFQEISLFRTYLRLLKREKPDLVITYSIKPNIYVGLLCRLMRIPYCANVQGLGTAFQSRKMASLVSLLYRISLSRARRVFFENKANATLFVRRKILPARKITLLTGAGVNLEYFPLKPYPSEEGGIHFLYLGRIMREKGMDELVSAMYRLKEEFRDKVHFDLVGFYEDDYKEKVDEMSRQGILDFHGFQEDPRPWYASSHCIVLPSWHEGMSNVLLEGAASGRALITSDIPGCREAVDEGGTGYLTEVKNADSLYAAMKSFLLLSSEERAEMGRRGRRKMEKEFDRRKVVKKVMFYIRGCYR